MQIFSSVLGGVGVFLLGMTLMANGLKSLAGDALRSVLSRFAGGTFSAILSGAGITALVQSSSATTLTTIGFVSAGLLSFPQAVGVIFGSNIGTTSTGWIVSLIGFKLNISLVALPLVGAGMLLSLFSRGRYSALGLAVAGFGLVFVGIDILRVGMEAITLDPGAFAGNNFGDRLVLIIIGAVMTVLMQSSSAAVATTLAALHSGAIVIEQAAALVIGQNIGTTVTAALGSIGGSVPAKRTALAHILFNVITGIAALVILPIFLLLITELEDVRGLADPSTALAAFHTGFNVLGLILLVPFMKQFINLVTRLIPEKGLNLTRHLDPSVAEVGPVAVEAARRTLIDITALVFKTALEVLPKQAEPSKTSENLDIAENALHETRRFLSLVRTDSSKPIERQRHLSVFHAIDHLDRFIEASKETEIVEILHTRGDLKETVELLKGTMNQALADLKDIDSRKLQQTVQETSVTIADLRRSRRSDILKAIAKGQTDPDEGLSEIRAMIWLDRLGYHMWRTVFHIAGEKSDMLISSGVFEEGENAENRV